VNPFFIENSGYVFGRHEFISWWIRGVNADQLLQPGDRIALKLGQILCAAGSGRSGRHCLWRHGLRPHWAGHEKARDYGEEQNLPG
jgi:hypothetical protein